MDERIQALIDRIGPLDEGAMAEAQKRQDYRVKVPHSLGRLEDISIRLAGITGKPFGNDVSRQAIIIMSADNGVVEEGVASAPQTVTLMQTVNFTKRITGVGTQAAHFGIDILDIDVGVRLPIPAEYLTDSMLQDDGTLARKVVNRRIACGTKNFLREPAMTKEETIKALLVGAEAVDAACEAGIGLLGVGEMGIGNTTTGSAMICALTGLTPAEVAGRGGGLNDAGLARKIEVLEQGLEKYGFSGALAKGEEGEKARAAIDPVELLSCLGGFDIAGMAGAYLAAAARRVPVVVDGVISIAAALVAKAICPMAADYMFTSHRSQESGYTAAASALGIEPMFDLGMKLGEGSGCPIAFKIIEAACCVMNDMWSLEEAQVDSEYLEELRGGSNF